MVDKSRRVDVDGSLKEREWNTEEFYAVLNQHTEEVRQFVQNNFENKVDCSRQAVYEEYWKN